MTGTNPHLRNRHASASRGPIAHAVWVEACLAGDYVRR
jgi:hypothetical protein